MGKVKLGRQVFNTEYELGLRMVYLLVALGPGGADLQKLVLLDYAVVYSGDLDGPPSLHTPVPFRGTEMLVRRQLIENGLRLMSTRGLVSARLGEAGVLFVPGPFAHSFVGSANSPYFRQLETRCAWASKRFEAENSVELTGLFHEWGHRWGAELASMAGD